MEKIRYSDSDLLEWYGIGSIFLSEQYVERDTSLNKRTVYVIEVKKKYFILYIVYVSFLFYLQRE